ncbi:MAG: 4-alpha-glucanotransferase [Nannocystaceae bacterium]
MMPRAHRPTAGLNLPLSALYSQNSWGIGEIPDISKLAHKLHELVGGLRVLQLLPLTPMSLGCNSPYSSCSSFGIDPIYLSVPAACETLAEIVHSQFEFETPEPSVPERVAFAEVRKTKLKALRRICEPHLTHPRLQATLNEFSSQQPWVNDFALFQALTHVHANAWWKWPTGLRSRDSEALANFRVQHRQHVDFFCLLQWLCMNQWAQMRRELQQLGMTLMGDLPFMVAEHSFDVWAYSSCFDRSRSLGVPGDAFDADGQDWTLPAYRWDALEASNYAWIRRRVAHMAGLFDRLRVDHAVGLFRTYSRECSKISATGLPPGSFSPDAAPAQQRQGHQVFSILAEVAEENACSLIAEDLGVIPEYVAPVLAALGLPGYRVIPWERTGTGLTDPRRFPTSSVACFGTHDTPPLAGWWEAQPVKAREEVLALAGASQLAGDAPWGAPVHQLLLDLVFGASSELAMIILPDLFASSQRLNTPGTIGEHNWTYRLPCPIESLANDPQRAAAIDRVRSSIEACGRA